MDKLTLSMDFIRETTLDTIEDLRRGDDSFSYRPKSFVTGALRHEPVMKLL